MKLLMTAVLAVLWGSVVLWYGLIEGIPLSESAWRREQGQKEFDAFWDFHGWRHFWPRVIIATFVGLGLVSLVWASGFIAIAAVFVATLYLLVPFHKSKYRREMRRAWKQRETHLAELRQRAVQDRGAVAELRDNLRFTLELAEDIEAEAMEDDIAMTIPRLRLELNALDREG